MLNLERVTGIEPASFGLEGQTYSSNHTHNLVLQEGLEPPSPDYKTGILAFEILEHKLVSMPGFEPGPLGPKPSTQPDNASQR